MGKRSASRTRYPTGDGDLRRAPPTRPDRSAPTDGGAPGRVMIRRQTAGRRGKTVTTVSDVPVDDVALRELAGRLKKRCGVGGAVKDGTIELQGDHRDTVLELVRAEGYDAVLAGG